MPQTLSGCDGVDVLCLENLCLVVGMDGTLLCHQKAGSALYAARTQHQRSCDTPAVCNSSGCQYRDFHRITYLRDQRHGGQLPDVSARFTALGDDCKRTAALDHPRHCGRGYHRDDLDSGLHPLLHVLSRVTRSGDDHRDLLLYHNLRYLIGKRAHQHHIDSKWAFGQLSGFVYLLAQPFGVGIHRSDDA